MDGLGQAVGGMVELIVGTSLMLAGLVVGLIISLVLAICGIYGWQSFVAPVIGVGVGYWGFCRLLK